MNVQTNEITDAELDEVGGGVVVLAAALVLGFFAGLEWPKWLTAMVSGVVRLGRWALACAARRHVTPLEFAN